MFLKYESDPTDLFQNTMQTEDLNASEDSAKAESTLIDREKQSQTSCNDKLSVSTVVINTVCMMTQVVNEHIEIKM